MVSLTGGRTLLGWACLVSILSGCGGGSSSGSSVAVTAPVANTTPAPQPTPTSDPAPVVEDPLDQQLLALIDSGNLTGDAADNRTLPAVTDPLVQLGKRLFFSKSLGGDFDAACVSCHHPVLGGADALSLPVGVGAVNPDLLGPGRVHANTQLPNVPRHSPTVFNAGLWDTGLFFDSRVESFGKEVGANGAGSNLRTPDVAFGLTDSDAGPNLPSAQARFPVTSADEMRGLTFESGASNDAVRAHLAARIGGFGVAAGELPNNQWLAEFRRVFGIASAEEIITFDNIALALGEYERSMVFTDNAFKAYVNGDMGALSDAQKRGGVLFFTDADADGGGCATCHSGDLFSDGAHHTVAFPQFGPGKGDGNDDDFGRERESGLATDRYRFRTPSLLNIEATAPYGHAGAYSTLSQVVAHYNNPNGSLDNFFVSGACGLAQFADTVDCATLYPNAENNSNAALRKLQQERNAGTAEFLATNLNNNERDDIVAFLRALTDPCVYGSRLPSTMDCH